MSSPPPRRTSLLRLTIVALITLAALSVWENRDGRASRVPVQAAADSPAFSDYRSQSPGRSHGIGLRPDGKELWMCDVFHDRTYVFDLSAEPPKQVATVVMKGGGYWMCFSPDGKLCYISERIGDTVAVIDTASRKTVARIEVGKAPKRLLVVDLPQNR